MAKKTKPSLSRHLKTRNLSAALMPVQTSANSGQIIDHRVDFAQSVELVQTLICAIISTVANLRSLFPDDCFKVHHYDLDSSHCSYKDFIDSADDDSVAVKPARRKRDHQHVPWDILVRGKNRCVDKLLDWLELGVADALNHKYLAMMQLGIYDGEVIPSKRLEAYTMTFTYAEAGVELKFQHSRASNLLLPQSKTLGSAKQELRYLVHRLTRHIGGFPMLPPRSVIDMHFTYNNSCPPAYQPPGFITCQDNDLILESHEGALVGSITPGKHRVDLRVFVNDERVEEQINKNPLLVTLRSSSSSIGSARVIPPTPGIETRVEQGVVRTEVLPVLALLHEIENHPRRTSADSNVALLDTQEKKQVAAIASMAHLRSAPDNTQNTQLLEATVPEINNSYGDVDLDGGSSVMDESTSQSTPSTVYHRCTRQSASRSSTVALLREASPPVLRTRKRQNMVDEIKGTPKFTKISKARSPFTTASLRGDRM